MNKILTTEEITQTSAEFHKQNKKIVLIGGCFDLLHIGHIIFLEEAKKQGDLLIVFLESDDELIMCEFIPSKNIHW